MESFASFMGQRPGRVNAQQRGTASVQAPASMSDSSSERFKLLRNTSLPAGLIQRRQAYQTKRSLGRSPQIKTKCTSEFNQRISVRISGTCPDLSVTHNTPGTPGGPADSAAFPMGGRLRGTEECQTPTNLESKMARGIQDGPNITHQNQIP